MKNKNNFTASLITLLGFFSIFFIYLFNLENPFIVKMRISGLVILFPIPILFFVLLLIYIYTYSKLLNKKLLETFFEILPLAIFWQLSFFLIEMIGVDPWKGTKSIFLHYSHIYLTLTISSCLVIIYKLNTYFTANEKKPLIIIPGIIFIVYLLQQILRTHSYNYLIYIFVGYMAFLFLLKTRPTLSFFNKKELLFVLLVFILAFVIRFAWGVRVISLTGNQFYAASDDGITYGPNAENWASGINTQSAFGTFGGFVYSLFLGSIYKIFGNPNYYAVVLIQSILGGSVAVCVYYIARRITNVAHAPIPATKTKVNNSLIAKASAIVVSLNMNNIFTSIVVGMEALFIPLVFIFLFCFITCINNRKIISFKYSSLTGVLFGIATIVRPEVLLFPIVIGFCFFLFNRGRFTHREITKITFTFIFGFLIVLFSYCLRNYIKEGRFDFRTNSAAISFSLVENNVREGKILSEMGFNPFENLGNSLGVITKKPLVVSSLLLKGTIKKGFNYLFSANFGEMDFLTLLNNAGITNAIYRFPVYCQFYIYLFVFTGAVMLIINKGLSLEKNILLGYIFYTIIFYAVIYSRNARYRAVLEPLFIILFTYTLYLMIERFKRAAEINNPHSKCG